MEGNIVDSILLFYQQHPWVFLLVILGATVALGYLIRALVIGIIEYDEGE